MGLAIVAQGARGGGRALPPPGAIAVRPLDSTYYGTPNLLCAATIANRATG